jgi:hypothetical protein
MKLQLTLDFDLTNGIDQRFLSWYESDGQNCKNVLLLGFMMLDNGMMLYYDEKYKKDIESIWINKYDKVVLEKKAVECTVQETLEQMKYMKEAYEQMYDAKYRSLYENTTHELNDTVRVLQEKLRTREYELSEQNNRLQDVLRKENDELRGQLSFLREEQLKLIQALRSNHEEEVNRVLFNKERECNDMKALYKLLETRNESLEQKLQVTEQYIDRVSQQKAEDSTRHKQLEIDMLKKQLQHYIKTYEEASIKIQTLEQENKEVLTSKYDQLERLRNDEYINQLKSTIAKQQTEMAVLKNSNAYKGFEGEKCIKDILCRLFTDCEVRDTSKKGGQSDIHLVTRDGFVIVIESKNKSVITNQDVEKSYSDINVLTKQFGNKLIGYIFVSHRTPNIPKKGNMYFERHDNLPVVWYGMEDTAYSTLLEQGLFIIVKLLMCDKCSSNEVAEKADDNLEKMFSTVKGALTVIGENIATCAKLQDNINGISMTINTMAHSNQQLYENITQTLGIEMPSVSLSPSTSKKCVSNYVCMQCKTTFKRKCDLTNHMKTFH